jgi:hypothetical protein
MAILIFNVYMTVRHTKNSRGILSKMQAKVIGSELICITNIFQTSVISKVPNPIIGNYF